MTTLTQFADHQLLQEAQQLGGHKTKRKTVNEALKEYILWLKRIESIKYFGTFEFDPEFLAEIDRRSQPH